MFLDCARDYLKHYGLEDCKEGKAAALSKEVLAHAESEDLAGKSKYLAQFESKLSALRMRTLARSEAEGSEVALAEYEKSLRNL